MKSLLDNKLRVYFSNGKIFDIPVHIIAHHRAKYYAEKEDTESAKALIYTEEYETTIKYKEVLIDWAENNMDWYDVRDKAILITRENKIDYNKEWINTKKEIVKDEENGEKEKSN